MFTHIIDVENLVIANFRILVLGRNNELMASLDIDL